MLRLSKLSSAYECCSENSFHYLLRHNILNHSFILNEDEFNQILDHLKEKNESKNIKILKECHIIVPENYNENKFVKYLKKKYKLDTPFINIIYITFNTQCNLDCKYCYVEGSFDNTFKDQTMNKNSFNNLLTFLEIFIKDAKKSKQIGSKISLIFYGSEPLLHPGYVQKTIERLSSVSRQTNIHIEFEIITNGTLINNNLINLFKKYNVQLAISIDGPKEINDLMRPFKNNKGTYDKVVKNIKRLNKEGIIFGVSCTIGPHNINDLSRNIPFFKKLGAGGVGFNLLLKAKNKDLPFVSINKSNDMLIEASSFARKNKVYEDRIQRKIKSFNKSEPPRFKDCGAPGNQLVFYPSGDIGICQAYLGCRKYLIGNINNDIDNPLKILDSDDLKKWSKRYPLNMKYCVYCPAVGICGGGCIFNAEIAGGSISSIDKSFCVHTIKTFDWLIRKSIEEKLGNKDIFIRDISFMFSK